MKSIFSICILLFLFSSASAQDDPKFDINDRVVVSGGSSESGAPVRDAPQGNLLGTQPIDALGTVLAGPTTSENGGIWYEINYDSGVDGWTGEDFLAEVLTPGAPSVSLTAPADGATVSGTVTISANASDDEAVLGVQFRIDGVNLGAEDTTSPYAISWDTTAFSEGQHVITAKARDSSTSTTSPSRTVTVDQTPGGTTAFGAFPGAMGGGAASKGGRGGAVIMVTNLDGGTGGGSLRACVLATGPRTCIFRKGGTITLGGEVFISKPFLTIAGQTAPGGGIQLKGKNIKGAVIKTTTNNVIIRYIRARHGWNPSCDAECGTNATLAGKANGYNIMIDHVSTAWNQDEGMFTNNGVKNVTFSWNIVTEPVGSTAEDHPTGWYSGGSQPDNSNMTNVDWHHNLTTNNSHRNPLLRNKSSHIVNNLWYNQEWYITHVSGGISLDNIGNKYKRGPLDPDNPDHEVGVTNTATSMDVPGDPSIYMSGNIGYHQPNPAGNQWAMVNKIGGENGPDQGPMPTEWRRSSPLPKGANPIIAEPVADIEGSILPIVGASRRLDCNGNWVTTRDSQDQKTVNQYQNGTGPTKLVRRGDETGYGAGFPTIADGVPCPDADLDGMPDAWESARPGLSNSNPGDRNGDLDNDGYTNLEEYMAGPQGSETPPPPPPVEIIGKGAIKEFGGGRSSTGKVDVKGGPERRPFGRGAVQ